jgi:hypothetical protein
MLFWKNKWCFRSFFLFLTKKRRTKKVFQKTIQNKNKWISHECEEYRHKLQKLKEAMLKKIQQTSFFQCVHNLWNEQNRIFDLTFSFFEKEKMSKKQFFLFHKMKMFWNFLQKDGKVLFLHYQSSFLLVTSK